MRWYDEHPKLSRALEALQFAPATARRQAVGEALYLLQQLTGDLLERTVQSFPYTHHRRRWYDRDPELWLLVNGLEQSPIEVRDAVAACLDEAQTLAA